MSYDAKVQRKVSMGGGAGKGIAVAEYSCGACASVVPSPEGGWVVRLVSAHNHAATHTPAYFSGVSSIAQGALEGHEHLSRSDAEKLVQEAIAAESPAPYPHARLEDLVGRALRDQVEKNHPYVKSSSSWQELLGHLLLADSRALEAVVGIKLPGAPLDLCLTDGSTLSIPAHEWLILLSTEEGRKCFQESRVLCTDHAFSFDSTASRACIAQFSHLSESSGVLGMGAVAVLSSKGAPLLGACSLLLKQFVDFGHPCGAPPPASSSSSSSSSSSATFPAASSAPTWNPQYFLHDLVFAEGVLLKRVFLGLQDIFCLFHYNAIMLPQLRSAGIKDGLQGEQLEAMIARFRTLVDIASPDLHCKLVLDFLDRYAACAHVLALLCNGRKVVSKLYAVAYSFFSHVPGLSPVTFAVSVKLPLQQQHCSPPSFSAQFAA